MVLECTLMCYWIAVFLPMTIFSSLIVRFRSIAWAWHGHDGSMQYHCYTVIICTCDWFIWHVLHVHAYSKKHILLGVESKLAWMLISRWTLRHLIIAQFIYIKIYLSHGTYMLLWDAYLSLTLFLCASVQLSPSIFTNNRYTLGIFFRRRYRRNRYLWMF